MSGKFMSRKKIKMYYACENNMGDRLNVLIMDKCFGLNVVRRTPVTCSISGIGSGLGQFTVSKKKFLGLAERIAGVFFRKVYIWGTGFICYSKKDAPFYRKNMQFCAVRGELSKKRVEKLLGVDLDIPLADGGLLADELIDVNVEKKYKIGIIAHFWEQDAPIFETLHRKFEDSIVIDLKDDPIKVLEEIAACECIISSSLHGLIVADSFHIPNLHLVATDKLLGDGFKFDDYYSSYGMEHPYITAKEAENIEIADIIERYKIRPESVEKKKIQLKECFPFRKGE